MKCSRTSRQFRLEANLNRSEPILIVVVIVVDVVVQSRLILGQLLTKLQSMAGISQSEV